MSAIKQFQFEPEENPAIEHKKTDSFFICFSLLCVGILGVGAVYWLSPYPLRAKSQKRHIQSVDMPLVAKATESITLKPFVVRLKTKTGFKLTKVQVSLHTSPSLSLKTEIQNSLSEIEAHLLFMLSDKQSFALMTKQEKAQLQQELVTSLNAFLMDGQIKQVDIKTTFLR